MLRKFLDIQLKMTEKGSRLERLRPLITALDTFLYEPKCATKGAPHIRDAVDLKRWMIIVVFALLPCILVTVWNTGIQKFVYASGSLPLMKEFYASCHSLSAYYAFSMKDGRLWTILEYGLAAFLPVVIISYMVGGLCEAIFAVVRKHEIAEGFLVTGILYALILPPTIPYWMVAVGVAAGVVLSKELFGGTGMNIMNPALCCRALLFFTFPGQMSGDVWVGTNPTVVRESLRQINQQASLGPIDGYTQATSLAQCNIGMDIKRVHIEAIGMHSGVEVPTHELVQNHFAAWSEQSQSHIALADLNVDQLKDFVTSSLDTGGLGLSSDNFERACHFASVQFEQGLHTDWNFFLGNKLGCFGETSVLACLLGAALLIYTRIGSWRTMMGVVVGAFGMASMLWLFSRYMGVDHGAWNPAVFGLPPYKHLLLGGLAFGCVFMATDPVSSATLKLSKWIYGIFIGVITIVIRTINPAYPEGVMLAILTGNVFAPMIDHYVAKTYRRRNRVTAK